MPMFGRSLPPAICAIAVLLLGEPALTAGDTYSLTVTADSVTVGDLLSPDMTAGVGEDVLDRVLLTGLRPGEQRILTPAEIRLRLAEAALDPNAYPSTWYQPVAITRLAQVVSSADLVAAGEAAIRRELRPAGELRLFPGDRATVRPVTLPRPLLAPVGDISLNSVVRPPGLAGGLWVADIAVTSDGASTLDCTLRYRVRITGRVLVATRPIRRGRALAAEDVVLQTRELSRLRGAPLRGPAALAGQRAARAASPGTILSTDWIEPIPAVRRGESITAIAHIGRVRATTRALALADGSVGDVVRVRTPEHRKEFLVRIAGPGRAEVIVSP